MHARGVCSKMYGRIGGRLTFSSIYHCCGQCTPKFLNVLESLDSQVSNDEFGFEIGGCEHSENRNLLIKFKMATKSKMAAKIFSTSNERSILSLYRKVKFCKCYNIKAFYGIMSIGSHVGYVAQNFKVIIICHLSENSYEKVSSYLLTRSDCDDTFSAAWLQD